VSRRQHRRPLAGALLAALVAFGPLGCGAGDQNGQPAADGNANQASEPATLHPPVRSFVDAVAAKDADKVADAFTSDGVVIDVSRRIEGHQAIRQWAANELVTGTLAVVRQLCAQGDRQCLLVRFAPGGSGGFEANYTFTISADRITTLDMQYA